MFLNSVSPQVRKWISDWNLTTEKKHTLLRLLYEALVDCKKRYPSGRHTLPSGWYRLAGMVVEGRVGALVLFHLRSCYTSVFVSFPKLQGGVCFGGVWVSGASISPADSAQDTSSTKVLGCL